MPIKLDIQNQLGLVSELQLTNFILKDEGHLLSSYPLIGFHIFVGILLCFRHSPRYRTITEQDRLHKAYIQTKKTDILTCIPVFKLLGL